MPGGSIASSASWEPEPWVVGFTMPTSFSCADAILRLPERRHVRRLEDTGAAAQRKGDRRLVEGRVSH